MNKKSPIQHRNLRVVLSISLKAGVFLACVLMVVGLILKFAFEDIGTNLTVPLTSLALAIVNFDLVTLISLGITILLFMPIALVIIAAAKFFHQRDKLYFGISLILLCILALNIFLSIT